MMEIQPEMLVVVVPPFTLEGVGVVTTTKYRTYAEKVGRVNNRSGLPLWVVYPPVPCESGKIHAIYEYCLRPLDEYNEMMMQAIEEELDNSEYK